MTEAEAHIVAQARLREITVQAVKRTWENLPNYDEESVGPFLALVVPLVLAAQRQSAALTNAFLARALGRQPLGIDVSRVIGAAIRNGTTPDIVYRRPFVTTWTALRDHTPYATAVNAGMARASSSAAMDVQNTMRHTLRLVGGTDTDILGYRRVPDADACAFCRLIAGRRYLTDQLLEVHPHCGCGVGVITAANRGDFTGKRENDLAIEGVAVAEHGELGPLLVSPTDHFTSLADIAA
jgi:hypothetical protein